MGGGGGGALDFFFFFFGAAEGERAGSASFGWLAATGSFWPSALDMPASGTKASGFPQPALAPTDWAA
jgi:hypothetical protein